MYRKDTLHVVASRDIKAIEKIFKLGAKRNTAKHCQKWGKKLYHKGLNGPQRANDRISKNTLK